MVAAGLAATWALIAQLPARFSSLSPLAQTLMFVLPVVAYIMKDRIKEMTKEWMIRRMHAYDQETELVGSQLAKWGLGSLRGSLREKVSFLNQVPDDVLSIRQRGRWIAGARIGGESVLVYRRKLEILAPPEDQPRSTDELALRQIIRLNLRHFMTRLDERDQIVCHYEPSIGGFATTRSRRSITSTSSPASAVRTRSHTSSGGAWCSAARASSGSRAWRDRRFDEVLRRACGSAGRAGRRSRRLARSASRSTIPCPRAPARDLRRSRRRRVIAGAARSPAFTRRERSVLPARASELPPRPQDDGVAHIRCCARPSELENCREADFDDVVHSPVAISYAALVALGAIMGGLGCNAPAGSVPDAAPAPSACVWDGKLLTAGDQIALVDPRQSDLVPETAKGPIIPPDKGYRLVDIVNKGYDMAIRISRLKDSTLIQRRISTIRHVCCASPAYLDKQLLQDHRVLPAR